ncbi:HI1506-related protein [Desulfuromonas sp. TF]|uniref:HI1506-related protein n=1 Tax=Desulfuromonas sp. TF TaxID=1232410 RepID=UPI000411D4B1|nr:HI1506-related protein [Desulfuromonas sp. TF]
MATLIRITAKKDGFRRCGIAHSKAPTDYPADKFTRDQLRGLKAEPMLTVEEIETEEKEKAPPRPNAAESIKLVVVAATLEDLDKLAEGEERKTVLEAIEKRRQELSAPQA